MILHAVSISSYSSPDGFLRQLVEWYFDHPSQAKDPFISTYPDGSPAPLCEVSLGQYTSEGLAAGLLWTQIQRQPDGTEHTITIWQPVDHSSYQTAPDLWGGPLLAVLQEVYASGVNACGPGNTAWWGGLRADGGGPNSWPFGPRDWVIVNAGGLTQAEIDAAPMDEWGGGAHSAWHLKYGGHEVGGQSLAACGPVMSSEGWIWPSL